MMIANKKVVASNLFVLISFVCAAQQGNNPPPPQPPPPPGLPIDGGLVMLIILGLAYGIYIILKEKKISSILTS